MHTADIEIQARSQAEARKPVLLHHMGLDTRNPDLVACSNKGADQPAHPHSLISAFVVPYLKSKVTRSDTSLFSIFGGLQHDKVCGYAHEISRDSQSQFRILVFHLKKCWTLAIC